MKNEISMPVVVALIAVAVVLIVGLGWFFMGRNDDHVAKFAGERGVRPSAAKGTGASGGGARE